MRKENILTKKFIILIVNKDLTKNSATDSFRLRKDDYTSYIDRPLNSIDGKIF